MNSSPTLKDALTSAANSQIGTMDPSNLTHIATIGVDQGVLPKKRVMLLPQHVDKLLPWYHHWSNKLPTELRLKRFHKEPTLIYPLSLALCTCDSEWRCEPHNTCFIHDSCFCLSSGSFPPVRPPRASLSLTPPS